MKTIEKILIIEQDIIRWAKLLATTKPDTTRFEVRADNLERLLLVRQGLKCLVRDDNS